MKFSNLLFFSSFAFAAPSALEPRQGSAPTVVGTLLNTIFTLESAIEANTDQIADLIESVKDNVNATIEAQVTAALEANYQAILAALTSATNSISSITTGAAGGILGAVAGLTQVQIGQLIQAINAAVRIVTDLQATLTITVTNLTPAIKTALQDEFNAVKAAISPFLLPLQTFLNVAKAFAITIGLTVSGLASAQTALGGVVHNLLASLGLPPIVLPLLPGLLGGS